MNMRLHRILPALLLSVAALVAGCDRKDEATQVVARVNSDEITVHQINHFLARRQNLTPEVADQAKHEILEKLVDQNLAKQKAIESKLDRSPGVMQTIEAAKSEILARAYLEHLASALPMPDAWETRQYYSEHPELFANRRLFELEEFVFAAKDDVAAGLHEPLSRARSMQEVGAWLRSRGIDFVASYGVRAAEQIPLDILPEIQAMKAGEMRLFKAAGGRHRVVRVVASKAAPINEATATPRIQQFLLNRRSSELIGSEMKKIREQAKIEFVGEFARSTAAVQTSGGVESEARAK